MLDRPSCRRGRTARGYAPHVLLKRPCIPSKPCRLGPAGLSGMAPGADTDEPVESEPAINLDGSPKATPRIDVVDVELPAELRLGHAAQHAPEVVPRSHTQAEVAPPAG